MNECLSRKVAEISYKTLVCEFSEFYNLKLLGALVFDTSLMTSRAKKLQSKTFHCVLIGVFHNVMMMPLQMNFIQRVRHYRPDIFDALEITPGNYCTFCHQKTTDFDSLSCRPSAFEPVRGSLMSVKES